MTPITRTQTGVGTSAIFIPDYMTNPFNIGLGVVVSGSVTYNVEHTFDDTEAAGYNPATGNWFVNTGFSTVQVNADGNYVVPVRGLRLNVTAGTGTATMTICQAGTR